MDVKMNLGGIGDCWTVEWRDVFPVVLNEVKDLIAAVTSVLFNLWR